MSLHDEAMVSRLHNALNSDKRISGLPIDIRVSGDDVYVKGSVNSPEEIDVIQFILSGVSGVRHINVDEVSVREAGR